jgi:hypothetical protein
VIASVDVVSQEEVVIRLYITVVVRDAPKIKEAHQVLILAVNVAENFDGSIDS